MRLFAPATEPGGQEAEPLGHLLGDGCSVLLGIKEYGSAKAALRIATVSPPSEPICALSKWCKVTGMSL
jgi:hypothetical protein